MEILTVIILVFMFVLIYLTSLMLILYLKNKKNLLSDPPITKERTLSILIPAWNEEETIEKTIDKVMDSDYKGLIEVIVLNDFSTDNTVSIVKRLMKKYPKLKLFNNKKNLGKPETLNLGIKSAKGELVGIVDADSYPSKNAISKLIGYFDDEKMGAVTSCVTVRERNNLLEKMQAIEYVFIAWTRKLLDFVDAVFVTNGPLSIYRRKALIQVGGFDKKIMVEDTDVTCNLIMHGYKTAMAFSAEVTTTVPGKLKAWIKQRERWAIGGFQLLAKYRKNFLRSGIFGYFILPFMGVSIFIMLLGFIVGIILILKNLIPNLFFMKYSMIAGTLSFPKVNGTISVLGIYTIILFGFTIFSAFAGIISVNDKELKKITKGNIFNLLVFVLVYATLSPIVWFTAIYRMIKGDYRW